MDTRVETHKANSSAQSPAGRKPRHGGPEAGSSANARLERWTGVINACQALSPALTEALTPFWGVPVRAVFLGASLNMHYFWRTEDFHVSQLTLPGGLEGQPLASALLRVSDAACVSLLTSALGPRTGEFSFKRLSPFESAVLNELSRELLSRFKKSLIRKPARGKSAQVAHLVWVLQREEPPAGNDAALAAEVMTVGKLVLSLPLNSVRLAPLARGLAENPVPDAFFYHVRQPVRMMLGSTRLTLSDLNHLEPEDVIVLEQSHFGRMFLADPATADQLPFPVEIAGREQITMPYTQELAEMDSQQTEASTRQNLWDNLMIEVGAQFEPIKLPLRQLKQMSEGLVIEMGDLVRNRVALQVEGKTLAWGELVIVGDKFGVRVRSVEAANHPDEPLQPAAAPLPVGEAANAQAPALPAPSAAVDEEINLTNFLNEDFDETFADDGEEEDW